MSTFRQTVRDLPVIGYFVRVMYALWKLPVLWDVLIGYVQVQHSPSERIADGASADDGDFSRKLNHLTASVIDLSALVREQAAELSELRQTVEQFQQHKPGQSRPSPIFHGPTSVVSASAGRSPRLEHSEGHEFAPVYLGGERLLIRTQRGQLLVCKAQDILITPQLIHHRVWQPAITKFYMENIAPGMKYLDIGANIGYFTVLAATLVGHTGRVHAFEPEPSAFSLLKMNCRMNNCSYLCELVPLALCDAEGVRTLHTFEHNLGGATLSDLPEQLLAEFYEEPTAQTVQCTTLDKYYSGDDIRFDFIKMDAEGAEPLIFSGACDFLSRCTHDRTIFVVEYNPQAMKGLARDGRTFVAQLLEAGYFVSEISAEGKLSRVTVPDALDTWCNAELILTRKMDAFKATALSAS